MSSVLQYSSRWAMHPRTCSQSCGSKFCNARPPSFALFGQKANKPPATKTCPECHLKLSYNGSCDCN